MPTLLDSLAYTPVKLTFGTSGLRGLVVDMTDLECYINTSGFLRFLTDSGDLQAGGRVFLAGDLRDSTPRILQAVYQAIIDGGFTAEYYGLVPTPAIAYFALQHHAPCIMVTGSHIPADRNGIKFYKSDGEVLKADEAGIHKAVAVARDELYAQNADTSAFTDTGTSLKLPVLPAEKLDAAQTFHDRYVAVFGNHCLSGKQLVFYQHSAVGRDLLADLFESLGATVVRVGRSDTFIPIDTENVTADDQAYFKKLAHEYPAAFAIVSTDGDSDRPFVIDSSGEFHRGDVLGAVVAEYCQADFAAYPVSASDAVDSSLESKGIDFAHTRIGSPFVIVAMQEAMTTGKQRVVGWEVNGGFLLGAPLELPGGTLQPLPTRDAFFPILVALLTAIDQDKSVADTFAALPARYTQAGIIDNFPSEVSQKITAHFDQDSAENRSALAEYFSPAYHFDDITSIDALDGIRISFKNGDIAHLRPSGNAPQLRIYSVAASQERADQIVADAIAEPDGIFRRLEKNV